MGRQIAGDRVAKGLEAIPATPAGRCVAAVGMNAERLEQAGQPAGGQRMAASPLAPRPILGVDEAVQEHARRDDLARVRAEHRGRDGRWRSV